MEVIDLNQNVINDKTSTSFSYDLQNNRYGNFEVECSVKHEPMDESSCNISCNGIIRCSVVSRCPTTKNKYHFDTFRKEEHDEIYDTYNSENICLWISLKKLLHYF